MSKLITYYLEMTSPNALQSKPQPQSFEVKEAKTKDFQLNRSLYQLVGKDWEWVDRLSWSDDAWEKYAQSDDLRTWVGYFNGNIAGYYELQQQSHGDVEIVHFGLASGFIGRGLGGYFLSQAVASAWGWNGTERVWLHTCTRDHASALKNYQARGFSLYKTENG